MDMQNDMQVDLNQRQRKAVQFIVTKMNCIIHGGYGTIGVYCDNRIWLL